MAFERLNIILLREQLGKVQRSEERRMLRGIYESNKRQMLETIRSSSKTLELLKEIEEGFEPKSRPTISAYFIHHHILADEVPLAFESFGRNQHAEARFLIDTHLGSSLVVDRLNVATIEYMRMADDFAMFVLNQKSEEGSVPEGEKLDEYLKLRRTVAEGSSMFMQDPTGFSLADSIIDNITTETKGPNSAMLFPQVMSPNYIIAGAQYGRDLYKAVYKIAEANNIGEELSSMNDQ